MTASETMRAVRVSRFGSPPQAQLAECPMPEPGPGELVVSVRAAPVNYVDLVTMRGEYQFKPALPYTPGKGPAGVVSALGAGVEQWQVGDRVLAMAEYGGYAETVVVGQRNVYRLPDMMPFVDAAAMSLAFDTAWVSLRDRARLNPGDSVLVLGANGAVGSAAIQLSRAMGASQVLAGVSSPQRFAGLEKLGATAMVDLSRSNLRDSLREQVHALTDGRGVDVVIDPLGGDAFDGAVRSVAWRGRLVIIGFAAGRIPTLAMNYPLLKNLEVSGIQISDYRKRMPELIEECYREVFSHYVGGRIVAPESVTYPLDRWEIALQDLSSRRATGRVLLTVT